MRADGHAATSAGAWDDQALALADDRPVSLPPRLARGCDCPCHAGTDVFHIVPCCGSVLGSLRVPVRMSGRTGA